MTKPLNCGLVSVKLGNVPNVLLSSGELYTASDVELLFADLDTNNDDLLDTDELAARCPPLDLLPTLDDDGEFDLTVAKFGSDDVMDIDDFKVYTCMSEDKLEHMDNKQCYPLCASNYVPDDTLKCKLEVNNMKTDGGYILQTSYSGFTTCVLSSHSCVDS